MPNDGQTELCNDSHRSLPVPNTTSKCADFLTHLCDRQSGCDVIFSSSVWQINTKCLNLLTTFHNKRRHSFETKEKAAPINIATIDQKVKHYKLKNPQNQVTNFYEDARLFTDSKPVTSVIALLPVWWAYVNIQEYPQRRHCAWQAPASGDLDQTLAWVYVTATLWKAAIW